MCLLLSKKQKIRSDRKVVQHLKVSSEEVRWPGVIEEGFLEMEFELVFGGWVGFQ